MSFASNLAANDVNGGGNDCFVNDRRTGTAELTRVDSFGQGLQDASSGAAAISADGRFPAFRSSASGLLPDDTNDANHIFVKDWLTGDIDRVSVDSLGEPGDRISLFPVIAGNACHVAFVSFSSNLGPGHTNDLPDIFVAALPQGGLVAAWTTTDDAGDRVLARITAATSSPPKTRFG